MRVIGCGTGRCGTVSFATLLDGCSDMEAIHEPQPILPWEKDETMYLNHKSRFDKNEHLALVAFYYIQYLEDFLENFPDLKVVCLKRNREDTIDSFMRKTGKSKQFPKGRNHWVKEAKKWNSNPTWSKTFPNYKFDEKREAIRQYWHDYYNYAEYLSDNYTNRFKIYSLDILNDRGLQENMFDFIGIDNPNLQVGLKLNETE